jgi:hypothetical protein
MAEVIKKGRKTFWVDPDGLEVPKKYVKEFDQKRDMVVEDVFEHVEALSSQMKQVKAHIRKELAKYLCQIAEQYGEDWQGSATIKNFAGTKEVVVKKSKKLTFDERLQVAKSKIDSYIGSLLKGQAKDLQALVNMAFRIDGKGNVDVKQILRLRKLNIKNKEWQQAMELIDESLQVESVKTYFIFRIKNKEDDSWETIVLNFNTIKAKDMKNEDKNK